jgi:hypothetical protein
MEDCKPTITPMEKNLKLSKFEGGELVSSTRYRQLIGSLIYLTNTRPDLSFVVNVLSRYMQEPRESHWNAAKKVLRYLQGTKDYGLEYKRNKKFRLVGYSDADFARDVDDRASTSGYLMSMGSIVVSWSCKKQATIANSTVEVEYISAWEATCEIVWLQRILQDLKVVQNEATSLFIDNQSTIKLAKNPFFIRRQNMLIQSTIIFELSSSRESSNQLIVQQRIKRPTFSLNLLEELNSLSSELNLVFSPKKFWIKGGIVRNYDPK